MDNITIILISVICGLIAVIVNLAFKDKPTATGAKDVYVQIDTRGIEEQIRLLRNYGGYSTTIIKRTGDELKEQVRFNKLNSKLGLIEQHLYSIAQSLKKQ